VNKLQEAEEIMINDGELTDEILDTLNIANNMGTNKDDYIIPRRRMIFMTNEKFIQHELAKLQEKKMKEQVNAAAKEKREAAKMLKATPERPSKKSRRDEPLISPSQSEDKNIHEDDEEPEAMDLSEIRCSLWIM
jgi:hypothetical protein